MAKDRSIVTAPVLSSSRVRKPLKPTRGGTASRGSEVKTREPAGVSELQPSKPEAVTEFLSELRNYQEPTDLSIPKSAFRARCREILYHETKAREMDSDVLQEGIWLALQEITEAWMVKFFQYVEGAAKLADRETVQTEDFESIKGLMRSFGKYPS